MTKNTKVQQIELGISQCLLGAPVRFDGGHKQSRYCQQVLAAKFKFIGLCPEVGIGLGTPRPTIRLIRDSQQQIRLVNSKDNGIDHTQAMHTFCERMKPLIQRVSGFVLAKGSPSCGPFRVKVFGPNGVPLGHGKGLFAQAIEDTDPLLPVEDEGRLNDIGLRDCFLTRVMLYHEWKHDILPRLTRQVLLNFHTRHKFLFLAHNQQIYRQLGPLLGNMQGTTEQVAKSYIKLAMQALKKPANRLNHSNALMHIQGFFKQHLSANHKAELTQAVAAYRNGVLPLMAPITLIKHYLGSYDVPYIANQSYLFPYPDELMARVAM